VGIDAVWGMSGANIADAFWPCFGFETLARVASVFFDFDATPCGAALAELFCGLSTS
jgi:hypothetical protein